MIKKPLVSIIIPCYNAENYIEECIKSVMSQDYEYWECIMINDGSKDKTIEFLKLYEAQDSRIKVLSQENKGLSATRNKGIENSNGDFIFFLDSDDYISHNAVSTLVSSFTNNDIITGILTTSDFASKKNNYNPQLLHPKEGEITFDNTNFEVLIRTMESGLTPVAQNRLYRKNFILENNILFKSGILHEDELWFFETMLIAKNVKFINSETYFYRTDNQNSITKNIGDKNLESYLQVMEEIIQKYAHQNQFKIIANWYAVYIKKIFLDFAIREKDKLSDQIITRLKTSLSITKVDLESKSILSKNNSEYYKAIQKLSLFDFNIIQKYFFRNPINSVGKIIKTFKILYLLK